MNDRELENHLRQTIVETNDKDEASRKMYEQDLVISLADGRRMYSLLKDIKK